MTAILTVEDHECWLDFIEPADADYAVTSI
jgi:hypothetical protein